MTPTVSRAARLPLVLAIVGLLTFWVPPIGLGISITSVVLAVRARKANQRFATLAIAIGLVGILAFIAFWAMVWFLSQ